MIRPVVFVSHNASRSGAPTSLLRFQRWLRAHGHDRFETVLLEGGPLVDDFAALGAVRGVEALPEIPADSVLYLNTLESASALGRTGQGPAVLTHVHEQEAVLDHLLPAGERAAVLARTDRFVAVTDRLRRHLVDRHGVEAERVSVHAGFVDVDELASDSGPVADGAALGIPPDAPVIGATGTLEWRKGPDLFIAMAVAVLESQPAIHLVWLGGEAEGPTVDPLREEATRAGVGDRVHFVGTCPDPFAWYRRFAVLVLPVREDPYPLACLEASLVGTPTVAFEGAGVTDLLTSAGGVVIPYPQVDAMANAAGELMAHPGRAEALASRVAERVRRDHDVSVAAPALWAEVQRVP